MNCYSCGSDTGDQIGLCAACREKRSQQRAINASAALEAPTSQAINGNSIYLETLAESAGFWLRLTAYVVDYFVVNLMLSLIGLLSSYPVLSIVNFNFLSNQSTFEVSNIFFESLITSLELIIGYLVVVTVVGTLYAVLFESSRYRATPGKMVLGLEVVTFEGFTLTRSKAFSRYCSKILSLLPLGVGYLVIAFHPEKLSFHDILTKTRVRKGANYKSSRIFVALILILILVGLDRAVPASQNSFNQSEFNWHSSNSGFSSFEGSFKKQIQDNATKQWKGF